MGVDFRNCDVCDTVIANDNNTYFHIKDIGRMTVCSRCADQMRSELTLAAPWTQQILAIISASNHNNVTDNNVTNKTITGEVCHGLKAAQDLLAEYPETTFGLFKGHEDGDNKMTAEMITAWTAGCTVTEVTGSNSYRPNVGSTELLRGAFQLSQLTDSLINQQLIAGETTPQSALQRKQVKLVGWYNHIIENFPDGYRHHNDELSFLTKTTNTGQVLAFGQRQSKTYYIRLRQTICKSTQTTWWGIDDYY